MIVGKIFSLDNFLRYYSNYNYVCDIIFRQFTKFDRINMKEEKEQISHKAWNKINLLYKISELKDLTVKQMKYLIPLIVKTIYEVISKANKLDKLNKDMNDLIRMALNEKEKMEREIQKEIQK